MLDIRWVLRYKIYLYELLRLKIVIADCKVFCFFGWNVFSLRYFFSGVFKYRGYELCGEDRVDV